MPIKIAPFDDSNSVMISSAPLADLADSLSSLKILVLNKTTKEIVPINIDLLITKTMSDDSNLNLKDENFTKDKNIYTTNFSLNEETNWIITGSFKAEDDTGFIFIKTNAK